MRASTRTKRIETPRGIKRTVKTESKKRTPARAQRRRRGMPKLASARRGAERHQEAA